MAEPFLGEIRLMSFNFAPKGWALCNGQLLPISQNQALFSLFGTVYGGDGRVNFGLPNLQGRCSIHVGSGFTQGQAGGETNHTLSVQEMPQHVHQLSASEVDGDTPIPIGGALGAFSNGYRDATNLVAIAPATISNAGASQPHENRQPLLTLSYAVALQGIFPSRN